MPHAPHCDRTAADVAYDLATEIQKRDQLRFRLREVQARISLLEDQLRPLLDQSDQMKLTYVVSIQEEVYSIHLTQSEEFGPVRAIADKGVHFHELSWPDVPESDPLFQAADAACAVGPALTVIDQEAS